MKLHEHIILEIARERERQITVEGWTPEHDDSHDRRELARAAGCYALAAGGESTNQLYPRWPWPGGPKLKSPRRDLIRAAALIVAEIERLDRLGAKQRAEIVETNLKKG